LWAISGVALQRFQVLNQIMLLLVGKPEIKAIIVAVDYISQLSANVGEADGSEIPGRASFGWTSSQQDDP